MEQLFNDIQQQIATKMGDTITLIDEDCGQLEALANGEDQYPVTFPCVLIGIPETIWETMKSGIQHGKTTLTVRLAFGRLNSYLHCWRFDECATVLIRRTSRQFSQPGGIKVYEMEYTTTVADEIQNNES